MLDRLVAWVLNNYLGKYVENLNTDQLSIALLRGSVELENLPLKKDALRHFGLPIKLKSGFIGKVKLKIPVTKIKSAPWHICIEDVTVIISPIHLSEWDKDLEEQAAYEHKLSLLDSMEAIWRTSKNNGQQQDSNGYYASSYNSWFSYGSGLVTTIIENLQLEIKNVHFRFEDDFSLEREPFAMGITIASLLIQSCNEKWEPGFNHWDPNTKYSYQLLQLNGFSVYWDSLPTSKFWGNLDLTQLATVSKTHTSTGHSYILLPVSGKTRVKRNRSLNPLRSRSHPRIVCDLQLESVPFSLSDIQYSEIIACLKNLNAVQQCQRYIQLRPTTSVKENPKAWWRYALNCNKLNDGADNLYETVVSWETCLQKAKENVAYVKLYTLLLSSPVGAATNLSAEMKELKYKIEWDRSFEELRILREVGMLAVRTPPAAPVVEKAKSEGGSTLQRWFPQWRGWYSSGNKDATSETAIPTVEDIKIDEDKKLGQIEDEILDVLADTVENNTILKRDTVFAQFNFELKEGTFSLISSSKNAMELQFKQLKLELESRPRTSSSRINVSLGGITLHDRLTTNSIFPLLISPQNSADAPSSQMNRNIPPTVAKLLSNQPTSTATTNDCLFQMLYEINPFNSYFNYRFHIWTQSLDVVYNPDATKWLVDFFTKPHKTLNYDQLRQAAKEQYNAMKQRTKEEIMKNWDKILQGDLQKDREHWDVKLDICAPQIFLVERFTDKNTVVCIVDFGKLYFTNRDANLEHEKDACDSNVTEVEGQKSDNESDDEFATPCSTPQDSDDEKETSSISQKSSSNDLAKLRSNDSKRHSISNVLYDNYKLTFSDLQILLGRMKDNWKFASLKGTSSLHVLDRFNITLQIGRRVFHTSDPDFPALKVYGNLPKLVVHTNEQKIQALCNISETISTGGNIQSPQKEPESGVEISKIPERNTQIEIVSVQEVYDNPDSKLLLIQFIVSHLALEVQSRGRCIAELQVSGVRATFFKQPSSIHLSLSVHSLLLVDALQTFGPDFELLIASHKHIGMDCESGSLRDSEPTSPGSPGSPDISFSKSNSTLPYNLTDELNAITMREESALDSCSSANKLKDGTKDLSFASPNEALILVELVLIKAQPKSNAADIQKASIQFNNLDIVANQETIVELISFFKRIVTQIQSARSKTVGLSGTTDNNDKTVQSDLQKCSTPKPSPSVQSSQLTSSASTTGMAKTEVTFNFHRLNVLLLRSIISDNGTVVAKKVATATMMGARIHAVVDDQLFIEGSLGGIQILDLTANGRIHQRILSVGQDPLKVEFAVKEKKVANIFDDISADIYNLKSKPQKKTETNAERIQAFSFTVTRLLSTKSVDNNEVDIKVRFSSALYTHAPHFVSELSSYATEFKQYLKNLARSIGSAATGMAIGLVHAKAETIAQSLSINNRFTFYGSTNDLSTSTPRKSKLSMSIEQGLDNEDDIIISSTGIDDNATAALNMKLDIVIDTPVIVLPRFATSYEVFIAHLGRITVNKGNDMDEVTGKKGTLWTVEKYSIEVRDMNLYSLDTQNRFQMFSYKGSDSALHDYPSIKAEDIYTCAVDAKPVLHDTLIQLCIEHDTKIDTAQQVENENIDQTLQSFQVSGKIVTPLKVSLRRQQYEQLLQTVDTFVAESPEDDVTSVKDGSDKEESINKALLTDIDEENELNTGVSALDLDPALRARMLISRSPNIKQQVEENDKTFVIMKVSFAIPSFNVELKGDFGDGEQSLVDVSFHDFLLQFEKYNPNETKMEVSLQSLLMEDLQREPNSKHRYMMTSSVSNSSLPYTDYVSISCPNLSIPSSSVVSSGSVLHSSLPNYLETETVFGGFSKTSQNKSGVNLRTSTAIKRQNNADASKAYPCTPPPSPSGRRCSAEISNEDNLVHITMVMYGKDSIPFQENKLSKTIAINFNTLNMIFNIESWLIVMDFFGVVASAEESTEMPISNNVVPSSPKKSSVSCDRSVSSTVVETVDEHDHCIQSMELNIRVKSLSVILNRTDNEIAFANVSKLSADIIKNSNAPIIGDVIVVDGEIGSLSVYDLTPVHSKLYGERFLTSDLSFGLKRYNKPDKSFVRDYDMRLKLTFPFMIYTHTQRFIFEIQSYFKHFSHLQSVLSALRSSAKLDEDYNLSPRILLDIKAQSPAIVLPVSSQLTDTLIIDLGTLSVTNRFQWTSSPEQQQQNAVSIDETKICLLDAMDIKLQNMEIFTGTRESFADGRDKYVQQKNNKSDYLSIGSYFIRKDRPSLLEENCELELTIERNLTSACKIVPDISIKGVLSKLSMALNLQQFKLLRGLLTYNLGEPLDDLQEEETLTLYQEPSISEETKWVTNLMQIDLVNVAVKLLNEDNEAVGGTLACINFIKSKFLVESFSDKSQDIDLISQEIIIMDGRFSDDSKHSKRNVFTNILQPLNTPFSNNNVRVELHLRKRLDKQEFTLVLHNMRLMAIIEWWEMLRDFVTSEMVVNISENNTQKTDVQNKYVAKQHTEQQTQSLDLKLNISNSEIVLIEDTSQWDTNAVIFKSTMVINYKPDDPDKPLSCNLDHCEMFSCILGMEDETALSIIDPVNINCEIVTRLKDGNSEPVKILQVVSQQLYFRLSYNDVRMFLKIYDSVPKHPVISTEEVKVEKLDLPNVAKTRIKQLMGLGFSLGDCIAALEKCNNNVDIAEMWLTENAVPENTSSSAALNNLNKAQRASVSPESVDSNQQPQVAFQFIEVKTDCFSVCIIDDCRDSDVPLLELLMNCLEFNMDVKSFCGSIECVFSIDYYNRFLSGWEPFIESWCCNVNLNKSTASNRLTAKVKAKDVLNINVTRTFLRIYEKVKETWTQDYYSLKESNKDEANNEPGRSPVVSSPNFRRRSPFIPFALKNNTGCQLWYITSVTTGNSCSTSEVDTAQEMNEDVRWISVNHGDVVPFYFEGHGKLRHRNTHQIRTHQIIVRIDGYVPIKPVSVDKVGVYFRHAMCSIDKKGYTDTPGARIVFDVTLEGSARKLITVRSALLLSNKLQAPIEVKLEKISAYSAASSHPPVYWLMIEPDKCEAVPLTHTHAQIYIRPIVSAKSAQQFYAFGSPAISWQNVTKSNEIQEQIRECPSNKGSSYRFCAVIRRENYPTDDRIGFESSTAYSTLIQPAHLITFISPMIIVNLLPYDLAYNVNEIEAGRISPGQQIALQEVNPNIVTEIHFYLENYPGDGKIIIPSPPVSFETKIKLQDRLNRRLNLRASVIVQRGSEIKVTVFSQYWIINKCSLPLIFRQEGVSTESAGQYEENELARMIAPLMLSLSDSDASPTIVTRVGNGVHSNAAAQWCQHFQLNPGVQVRKLKVSFRDNQPDVVYMIGINIRQGHGRYRSTYIVTLTSHYQIYNISSYTLQVAQKSLTSTVTTSTSPSTLQSSCLRMLCNCCFPVHQEIEQESNPAAQDTYLQAMPNCFLPFHWPRQDKDQLLSLKITDVPDCCWSGGFRIKPDSFHINIRDASDQMYFLRVEIILQNATFFILFTNAETIPPPMRIDNFSEVSLQFYQSGCIKQGTVRPHCSVSYAWDEPSQLLLLTLVAPGGVSAHYDVNRLGKAPQLTYENFIYIGFATTFNKTTESESIFDPLDVRCQQLVLDVVNNRVILNRKQDGARSQLWRMTVDGLLQHEGSSPPTDPTSKNSSSNSNNILVLDISSPGIKPMESVNLCLQKINKRRKSTQTWRFEQNGRLSCSYNNLCVQPKDGFLGLRKGNDVVLAPVHFTSTGDTPSEEMIVRQRLRPGSGCLEVNIITDGPTRVVDIIDVKSTKRNVTLVKDGDWIVIDKNRRSVPDDKQQETEQSVNSEYEINVELTQGIGLSLISNHPAEELLFTRLAGIVFNMLRTSVKESIEFSVKDIQIDNQLLDAQCPVMLYVTPVQRNKDAEELSRSAIRLSYERMLNSDPNVASNAEIFRSLVLRIKHVSIILEDRLLLKLFAFAGYSLSDQEHKNMEENDCEMQRLLTEMVAANTKRYYFEIIELILGQIRLSVVTSNKLPAELREIKKKLNLTLIKFEDAAIDLKPFNRVHVFETSTFLTDLIAKHFQNEIKWQAAIILGSVDFLGNPLGFVNDISEGFTGLIYEGNIGGLVQNVAHGLSNSAAKVTGTLSDGLGVISMDDQHQEGRTRIRSQQTGGSGHIRAGLKGLGHGLFGGVTSVFKQTYEGASNEGVQGFITGFGKGLVGTVTKPVAGMLDLASETASAVRDSSRSKTAPNRIRKPRCVVGPTGLLPTHSVKQSLGQEYLYTINHRNYSEKFIAYEILRSSGDDLQIIISTEKVRVFSCNTGSVKGCAVVIETNLSDLDYCQAVVQEGAGERLHYVELVVREVSNEGKDKIKRPKIRCDNEQLSTWVAEQVNYAKNMYIEKQHTLMAAVNTAIDD